MKACGVVKIALNCHHYPDGEPNTDQEALDWIGFTIGYYLKKSPSYAASCTYLKGWTNKLFLKGILEQYRPALEILGLRHGADGGGNHPPPDIPVRE